ncbi:MAG: TfoX/Sxy family protein [Pseudomonadota bacterium]
MNVPIAGEMYAALGRGNMSNDDNLRAFVLDQLTDLGEFETKASFGGTAPLIDGKAFAKFKNGALRLKVGDAKRTDFADQDMPQYRYGTDNARKLNIFNTSPDVLEDADKLVAWA